MMYVLLKVYTELFGDANEVVIPASFMAKNGFLRYHSGMSQVANLFLATLVQAQRQGHDVLTWRLVKSEP